MKLQLSIDSLLNTKDDDSINDSIIKIEQKLNTEFSKIEFETNEKEIENLRSTI